MIAWRIARLVVAFEIGMWVSLYRWIFRRKPKLTPGGQAFGYARLLTPVMVAFIGVSIVELPILHLLLPWPTVRLIADLISLYGLLWMFGLLASMRVNTHAVDATGLRMRSGVLLNVLIPWSRIAEVRLRDYQLPTSRDIVERTDAGAVLNIAVMKHTDIEILLHEPTTLPVRQLDGQPVTRVRFAADDARELVTLARKHLADAAVAAPGT